MANKDITTKVITGFVVVTNTPPMPDFPISVPIKKHWL